jgi:hypothetical protein
MTNQPRDKSKPADQPDKKKSETVQLTPEDLRAISGGQAKPLPTQTQAQPSVQVNKKP